MLSVSVFPLIDADPASVAICRFSSPTAKLAVGDSISIRTPLPP